MGEQEGREAPRTAESEAPVATKNGDGSRANEERPCSPRAAGRRGFGQGDWGQGGRIEPVLFPSWASPPLCPPRGIPGRRIRGTKPQCIWIFFPAKCTVLCSDLGAGGGQKGATPHGPQVLIRPHTFLLCCGIHAH